MATILITSGGTKVYKNFRWGTWKLDGDRPEGRVDPTPFLKDMK